MNAQTKDLSAMDRFKSVLKRHSLKATPQRLAVHEAMLSLGHASADQVCELLEMVESRIKSKRYRGYKVDGVDIQIICHPTTRKNTVTR